jgi:hypothetical protein
MLGDFAGEGGVILISSSLPGTLDLSGSDTGGQERHHWGGVFARGRERGEGSSRRRSLSGGDLALLTVDLPI